MKYGQKTEYSYRKFFFKNHAENEAGRLVSDLFVFKKALDEVKASGLQLSINMTVQNFTLMMKRF